MEDVMSITPLGSGQEVGRSCHLLEFRGQTILLDCGIHPGYEGLNGLPFFDRVDPETVDVDIRLPVDRAEVQQRAPTCHALNLVLADSGSVPHVLVGGRHAVGVVDIPEA